jgi:hypothetical protein
MGQHEITQKHTYLMGYCIYQKGTGTFVVVLAGAAASLAALSQSVTSGRSKGPYLLQIEIIASRKQKPPQGGAFLAEVFLLVE